jgi:hypothetical protein
MPHHTSLLRVGLAALVALAMVLPLQASIVTFNSRSDFNNALTSATNIDFESLGITPGTYTAYNTAAGLSIGGLQITGSTGSSWFLYAANSNNVNDAHYYNSGTVLLGSQWYPGLSYLSLLMPTGTTAFGVDLATMIPAGGTFQVILDGVNIGVQIITGARPNLTFFGVTSLTPFSEVRLVLSQGTAYQTQPIIDNIVYGIAAVTSAPGSGGGTSGGGAGSSGDPSGGLEMAETPEVTTVLYMISGLALIAWQRRRLPVLGR